MGGQRQRGSLSLCGQGRPAQEGAWPDASQSGAWLVGAGVVERGSQGSVLVACEVGREVAGGLQG